MKIFIWGITTSTQTLACSHHHDEPGVTQKIACSHHHDEPGVTQKIACSHRQNEPGVDKKACVFTSPEWTRCGEKSLGWTRCAHKTMRVHIARMNQVCTQKLACSHREDEPGVHTKACVFTAPGWTGCGLKSLRVHSARMNQVCTQKLACLQRQDEPCEHDAYESQTHWFCHLCLHRTSDVIWALKDNYWLNLQQVTPVNTYTNHKVYEV